jgi:hypothetical protein
LLALSLAAFLRRELPPVPVSVREWLPVSVREWQEWPQGQQPLLVSVQEWQEWPQGQQPLLVSVQEW